MATSGQCQKVWLSQQLVSDRQTREVQAILFGALACARDGRCVYKPPHWQKDNSGWVRGEQAARHAHLVAGWLVLWSVAECWSRRANEASLPAHVAALRGEHAWVVKALAWSLQAWACVGLAAGRWVPCRESLISCSTLLSSVKSALLLRVSGNCCSGQRARHKSFTAFRDPSPRQNSHSPSTEPMQGTENGREASV